MEVNYSLLEVDLLYEIIFNFIPSDKVNFILHLEFDVKLNLLILWLFCLFLILVGFLFTHKSLLVLFVRLKKVIKVSLYPSDESPEGDLLLAERFESGLFGLKHSFVLQEHMSLLVYLLPAHIPNVNGVFLLRVIVSFLFNGLVALFNVLPTRVFMHIKNKLIVHLNVV